MSFPLVSRAQYDEAVAQIAILRAQIDGQGPTIPRVQYDNALRQIGELQKEQTANLERIIAISASELSLKHQVEDLRAKLEGKDVPTENRSRPNIGKVLEIAAAVRQGKKALGKS